MLLNNYGVKGVPEVTDLDDHRDEVEVDAKTRVTMTNILQVAMSSFPLSDSLQNPPASRATLAPLDITAKRPQVGTSHADVA